MARIEEMDVKVNVDTTEAEANLERLGAANKRAHAQRSGWHSSKMHLALISIALITAVFLFVVIRTGSAAGWGEYCITIVSLAATFSGSRVAESFAARPKSPTVNVNG